MEEQQEVMKRRPNTQKGLNLNKTRQMEYLANVIDETLRRTTISMASFQESIVDVKLNGYIIPKGWKDMVLNRGVHLDPKLHIKPKEFILGRWDNEKPKAGFPSLWSRSQIFPRPGTSQARDHNIPSLFSTLLQNNLIQIGDKELIYFNKYKRTCLIKRVNPEAPINYLPIPAPSDKCLVTVTREASYHL
ncbi:hypothetical protein FEM48_Zijuj02G0061100 [Ziziphus jujuba var. spinosa]|uniref:Uncharacterized protein n=1 Tax=Ziziphus jujuba var. spinosa TaxID=714518 RepID=A0A978VU25_ZIZJJ|nr:hypothetical protein FEM48_Zijuj02G0061100 [Ziziphus jujuba var. spinosa]